MVILLDAKKINDVIKNKIIYLRKSNYIKCLECGNRMYPSLILFDGNIIVNKKFDGMYFCSGKSCCLVVDMKLKEGVVW